MKKGLLLILLTLLLATTAYAGGSIFHHNRKKSGMRGVYAVNLHICGELNCDGVNIHQGKCKGAHKSWQYGVCMCDVGYTEKNGVCVEDGLWYPSECDTNADCADGEQCLDGTCAKVPDEEYSCADNEMLVEFDTPVCVPCNYDGLIPTNKTTDCSKCENRGIIAPDGDEGEKYCALTKCPWGYILREGQGVCLPCDTDEFLHLDDFPSCATACPNREVFNPSDNNSGFDTSVRPAAGSSYNGAYCILKCPENHIRDIHGDCISCDTEDLRLLAEVPNCTKVCSNREVITNSDGDQYCALKNCSKGNIMYNDGDFKGCVSCDETEPLPTEYFTNCTKSCPNREIARFVSNTDAGVDSVSVRPASVGDDGLSEYCVLKCPKNHVRNIFGECIPCDTNNDLWSADVPNCTKACPNREIISNTGGGGSMSASIRSADVSEGYCVLKCLAKHIRDDYGNCLPCNALDGFVASNCSSVCKEREQMTTPNGDTVCALKKCPTGTIKSIWGLCTDCNSPWDLDVLEYPNCTASCPNRVIQSEPGGGGIMSASSVRVMANDESGYCVLSGCYKGSTMNAWGECESCDTLESISAPDCIKDCPNREVISGGESGPKGISVRPMAAMDTDSCVLKKCPTGTKKDGSGNCRVDCSLYAGTSEYNNGAPVPERPECKCGSGAEWNSKTKSCQCVEGLIMNANGNCMACDSTDSFVPYNETECSTRCVGREMVTSPNSDQVCALTNCPNDYIKSEWGSCISCSNVNNKSLCTQCGKKWCTGSNKCVSTNGDCCSGVASSTCSQCDSNTGSLIKPDYNTACGGTKRCDGNGNCKNIDKVVKVVYGSFTQAEAGTACSDLGDGWTIARVSSLGGSCSGMSNCSIPSGLIFDGGYNGSAAWLSDRVNPNSYGRYLSGSALSVGLEYNLNVKKNALCVKGLPDPRSFHLEFVGSSGECGDFPPAGYHWASYSELPSGSSIVEVLSSLSYVGDTWNDIAGSVFIQNCGSSSKCAIKKDPWSSWDVKQHK